MAQVLDGSSTEHVGSSLDHRIDELLPKGLTPQEICEEVRDVIIWDKNCAMMPPICTGNP